MALPKVLSSSLIGKLNKACEAFQQVCNCECDDVGWCDACWISVAEEPSKRKEMIPDEEGLRKVNDKRGKLNG